MHENLGFNTLNDVGRCSSGVVSGVSGFIPGGDNRRLERDVGPGGRVAGTRHVPRAEKTGTEHVPRAEETRVGEMEGP